MSNASKLDKNNMYAFLFIKQAAIRTKENPKSQRISKLEKDFYTSLRVSTELIWSCMTLGGGSRRWGRSLVVADGSGWPSEAPEIASSLK